MKRRYDSFFDSVAPVSGNDEFLSKVLGKAEKMENKSRKINFKPVIAAAAALAALSVGVTAAAATGIIDFNKIFGGAIKTESEALGESLIAGLQDFGYRVSDPDYIIVPNGLTGTSCDYTLSFDIRRADGKPVVDFLKKTPEGVDLVTNHVLDYTFETEPHGGYGGGFDSITVNEEGNLTAVMSCHHSNDLTGSKVSLLCSNIYDVPDIMKFCDENNVVVNLMYENGELPTVGFGGIDRLAEAAYYKIDEEYVPYAVELDDSGIVMLDLDFGISFTYSLSDTAEKRLYADLSEKQLMMTTRWGQEIAATELQLSGTGGFIRCDFDKPKDYSFIEAGGFPTEIYLTTKSGEIILSEVDSESGNVDYYQYVFCYFDDSGEKIAVDIGNIASVTVNGTILNLQ